MKRTDLAYVAGIIDGEGWITLCRVKAKGLKFPYYALRIGVGNTQQWLIEWLYLSFGGQKRREGKLPPRKPCWIWSLNGKEAANFLKLILPYLHLKKPQAEIVIHLEGRRTRGQQGRLGKGCPRTAVEAVLEQADAILLKSMNKKGVAV